jgi:predicted flavoprotein YhiN
MVQNSILAKEQYGFRSDSSTDKASYILTHEILTALNNKQIAGSMFCDLRKAFDVVNHKILLKKLEHNGIARKVNALVKSYLSERYQIVIQNSDKNSYSDHEMVKHGVRQGSMLGHLFFYYS